MRSLLRHLCCSAWLLGLALLLSGCGDTVTAPNPLGGTDTAATATPPANPTPAHIASWRTYQDSRFAFSIQYPPDWTAQVDTHVDEAAPYEVVSFFPTATPRTDKAPVVNVISITVGTAEANTIGDAAPPGFTPTGKVAVGGTMQTILSGPGQQGGQGLLVMYFQGGRYYLFSSNAESASASLFQQTFTQMLSTFVGPAAG